MGEFWPTTRASLINELQCGITSTVSWNEFVNIYGPLVIGFCRKHQLPHPDANDIAQEVFIRVFRGVSNFEYEPNKGRFGAWVGTIVRHEIARFISSNRKRLMKETNSDPLDMLATRMEDTWLFEERLALMAHALVKLREEVPELTWRIFEQTVLEDRKPSIVAAELKLSCPQVYKATFRANEKLRGLIRQLLEEESDS